MKKKLENKLKEYAEIRNFANTIQRKEMIDTHVRVFLLDHSPTVADYKFAYNTYKEIYKNKRFK